MLSRLQQITRGLPSYFGLTEAGESLANSKIAGAKLLQHTTGGAKAFADYLSYRYFIQEHQLFINDDDSVGFMLEISPIVGVDEGLLKNLRFFFNDEMPSNGWLQCLLVASHNVEPLLAKWESARTNKHAVLSKLTAKRLSFIREMANNFSNYDGRIARDYRIYLNFSQKLAKKSANVEKINLFRAGFIKKLSTLNLHTRICNAEDLIYIVRDLVQMNIGGRAHEVERTIKYDPINLLADQVLAPLRRMTIKEDRIEHHDSGIVSKLYYAKELPAEFSLDQMIGLLGSAENSSLGIPARFAISYTVASDVNKAMQAKLVANGHRAIHAAEQWYSRNDRDLKREAMEWKEIVDRNKNGEQFLTEHFSVMISSPKENIELAEQALISLYNILDFRLEINRNLQALAMISQLPLQQLNHWQDLKMFKLTRTCIAEEVIARLPIHGEWKGVPQAGVLLHARRGQLFNWNPFYRISSGNYNVSLFGPSGGGKSVFLQELVVSLASNGTRCFVLDIGESFSNICKLLDGEIIQFGKNAGLSLNPFSSFGAGMSHDDRIEFLGCAKALLSIMCGIKSDDAHESAGLEKAITAALVANNYQLDLTTFASYLSTSKAELLQKFGATLYPYTQEGIYGKYFSGGKAASFKELLTVFEFEEIKNDPKLLAIVLQILLMEVTNQFLTGDRATPFMIIVDEAWMLLDFAASFFAAFGRTVRKYGGSLVICVQNFTDLQKTQEHRAILENSTWTVMLKQDEKGMEAFKNSEAFKDMVPLIQSISLNPGKYSEVLLYSTGVKVVGRLVLDNYAKAIYSTDSADFQYIRSKTKLGLSLENSIEELAVKKYGKA